MAKDNNSKSGGIGFFGLLTIAFIVLKILGKVSWSWWWVLSPMWIPLAVIAGIFVVVVFGAVLFDKVDLK